MENEKTSDLENELAAERAGRAREQLTLHLMFKDLAMARRYLSRDGEHFLSGRMEDMINAHKAADAGIPRDILRSQEILIKMIKEKVPFKELEPAMNAHIELIDSRVQGIHGLLFDIKSLLNN